MIRTAFAFLIVLSPVRQDASVAGEKALKLALKDESRKDLDAAVKALVAVNSAKAIKPLLAAASGGPGVEQPWWMQAYWILLDGAASFTDPAALAELATFILKNKQKPVSRDALAMVANHGQKELIPVCFRILADGPDDLKLMAVDHLISIGDRTAVEPLIAALKANAKDAGDLKRKIGRALTALTGQDYGDSVSNWEGWWAANKDREWEVKKDGAGANTGTVTDTLDRSRASEFERLKKTGKVLVLQAGDKCKCKKNHDLDNIDKVTTQMGLPTETLTKLELETRDDIKLADYIAILANCTHIREHCVCPLCKPGGGVGPNRVFT